MKTHVCITLGLLLGLNSGLRAEFESVGPGPDLDALTGGNGDETWAFWVRTYVGYNDNVQFIPDAAVVSQDQESAYWGLTAQGAYEFMKNGDWAAGVALRLDQTFYFDSSGGAAAPDAFDLTVVQPALYLNYTNGDWYGRASYSYRWEDADTPIIGLDSHILDFKIGKKLSPCLHAELGWTHSWDDYETRAVGVNVRDGEWDRVSLSLIRPASGVSPRMILRYSYLNNDAEGTNFRYDGHELIFRVEAPLTRRFGLAAQVSYAELDYSTGARSEQDIFRAGVQLVFAIDENWSADLYYNYLDVDSNSPFFRGDRNDVGVGIRYDF